MIFDTEFMNENTMEITALGDDESFLGYMDILFYPDHYDIDMIAVAEEERRNHVATSLLEHFLHVITERDLVLPVHVCYPLEETTEAIHALFSGRNDFYMIEDGLEFHTDVKALAHSKVWRQMVSLMAQDSERYSLNQLAGRQLTDILLRLQKEGQTEIASTEELKEAYDPKLSFVCLSGKENLTIKTCLLAHVEDDGSIFIDALFSDVHQNKKMASVLAGFLINAVKYYPNSSVHICAINKSWKKLFTKITEDITDLKTNPLMIGSWSMNGSFDLSDYDLSMVNTEDDDEENLLISPLNEEENPDTTDDDETEDLDSLEEYTDWLDTMEEESLWLNTMDVDSYWLYPENVDSEL